MNKDKFFGTIFGQAVGDALGLGAEFMSKETMQECYPGGLREYNQIVQDEHRRRWQKGAWTDDTDMMLCIMDALIEEGGEVKLDTIARNFKAWLNGYPLGIGHHTFSVLSLADYTSNPILAAELVWKAGGGISASNGGVMRTSVVGLIKANAEQHAADICRLTHTDPRCVGSAVIVSRMIHELVYGDNETTLNDLVDLANRYDERILPSVRLAYNAQSIDELELCGPTQGYTLTTLSVALWAYWHAANFEEGLLGVVNAGGDADTNAAVACALLGAKFGQSSIPEKYIKELVGVESLKAKAERFYAIFTPRGGQC